MIQIQTLSVDDQRDFCYLVADRLLCSDISFETLCAGSADEGLLQGITTNKHLFNFPPPGQIATNATIYCGLGWLGGKWRETSIQRINNHGYWLYVNAIGDFYIAVDGSDIFIQSPLAQNNEWLAETVLGPVLTLALALQGTFCLHASAITIDGQVVAFVGESGWGKSTLVAYLNREYGDAWQFVADDVLPVILDGQTAVCLPHFPQLKLPADQQWGLDCPRRLPLTAVYLINPPDQANDSIHIKPLTTVDATLALVRHTVAAKLFDNQLLSKHLAFAATVANQVSVKQLIYPRIYEQLPAASSALIADLMG